MLWLLPAAVTAQVGASDKAAAEALFEQGLAHMREGKLAQACEELERSQAIERGIGTMLYLAECYEKLGRTASAWALFREAASVAAAQRETERANAGAARADRLAPLLSKLTLQVAPENQVEGFTLSRNNTPVAAASFGIAVPVDPGDHLLTASAPGRLSWSQNITVNPGGETVTVQVPALPVDASAIAPMGDQAAPPATTTQPQTEVAFDSNDVQDGSTQRIVGLVIGGAGIVAVGIGGFFGVRAIAKNKDAEELCSDPAACDSQDAVDFGEQAGNAADVSTVLMIGGAALVTAGVIVYFTAPDDSGPEVALVGDAHGAKLMLGGAF